MKTLCFAALFSLLPNLPMLQTSSAIAGVSAPEPLRIGGDVKRPEKLWAPPPHFPELARVARIQGVVILEAIIDETGNVTNLKVLKGLPMGLSEAALEAVQSWKFKPATLDGLPVRVYYTLTVNFKVGPIDPQQILKDLAEQLGPEPTRPDALLATSIREDVTAGRSRLADSVSWAEKYQGESRPALLTWLGAEAWRRAQRLLATDTERVALVETGLAAENAAISGEEPTAVRATLVAAMVYKHLLLELQAQALADPAAQKQALQASSRLLERAQATFDALLSLRAQKRARPAQPPGP